MNLVKFRLRKSLLLAGLACLGLAGPTIAGETTLKIATIVPAGTSWMREMDAAVIAIRERTDGRVNFKVYAGGVQGSDDQVRRKMRVGQLHGGVFTSGALGSFQPDADLYSLPLLFNGYEEVAHLRRILDPELRQRLEAVGLESFGFAGGGFTYLLSGTPVATRADMHKLKIWIPENDRVAATASQVLGIAPVTLPLTDVLTGLQTELIDTVIGPPVGIIVMQWHTAMRYVTDLPLSYAYAGLLLDQRPFSKLEATDQAVVREVMENLYRGFDAQGIADDRAALTALQDDGLQLIAMPDEEQTAIRAAMETTNRKAAADGVIDAALLARAECLLQEFRSGSAGTCES